MKWSNVQESFSARQNVENEHLHKHKNQIGYHSFFKP